MIKRTAPKLSRWWISAGLCLGFALLLGYFSGDEFEVESALERSPSGFFDHTPAPIQFAHFETLRLVDFKPDHFYLLSNTSAPTKLDIVNAIESDSRVDLEVTLTCDVPFEVKESMIVPGDRFGRVVEKKLHSKQYTFNLRKNQAHSVLMSSDIQECRVAFQDRNHASHQTSLKILNETVAFRWLGDEISHKENCRYSQVDGGLPVEKLFVSSHHPQLSCIHQADKIETLETPESGFLAKTEALLGYKLDPSFLTNQNPYAELDFSRAPKLDAIFVSTLVYRADFYGTVMARLLQWHADHGALVNVITTGYMMLDKDKRLLHGVADQSGNFRLQEFKYYDPSYNLGRPFRYVDSKYRDMHIKMFVTLSHADPSRNALIVGGRNIHDGFLFKTKPDYSKYPNLVQYGIEDDFVHWNDFEMKVTSTTLAQTVYAQLVNFWNRDSFTQQTTEFSLSEEFSTLQPNPLEVSPSASMLRHFVSVPYNDHHSLEALYVSLIDNAKTKIKLSSPYLRPTDAILAALNRAIARGVDVTIQTRITLEGDTQAWLYEEVNKESINRLLNKAKIYEWKENSILHSKFILIDGKVGFIGSVNLSRRSFIQDAENGFVIHDEALIQKMDTIFEGYLAKSKLITEAQKRKWFPSLVIQILKNQF